MSYMYNLLPTCHVCTEARIGFRNQSACYLIFGNLVFVRKIRAKRLQLCLVLNAHFHPSSLWFLSTNYEELGEALDIIINIIIIFSCNYTCIMYGFTH